MREKEAAALSFALCPETCEDLNHYLEETAQILMSDLEVPEEEHAVVDVALRWFFGQVKLHGTVKLRNVLIRVLQELTTEQAQALLKERADGLVENQEH